MNPWLKKVFNFYVFAYAFLFASRPIDDGDFWFHLKIGEYVFNTHLIPRTDFFSFTNYGTPWIAHGWLSGTIFYAVYSRAGFDALIFIFAVLTALAFWIVFRRMNCHPFIAGFATLLAVWTVLPTIGVRPRVFTLLLASIFLAVLTRYAQNGEGRKIWWLVPLMVLWVNLHGGFLIGLALIGLAIVGVVLDAWAAGEKVVTVWPQLKTLGLVLLACSLAALINPYGARMYSFTTHVLSSSVFQDFIIDWLSPNFHTPSLQPLLLLITLTIAVMTLSPKRVRPSELLFFLGTLYATLKSNRHMAIFALVAAPILANYLQTWLAETSFKLPIATSSTARLTWKPVLLSLLLLLPLMAFAGKLRSTVYGGPRQETANVPLAAVAYLKENQITGNTLTDPNIWGGYLIWSLPSNPVYIDGRDVYPEEFVKEFVEVTSGRTDWRGPFERYQVRNVVVGTRSILIGELRESSDWQQVFEDDVAVVFTRK